MSVKAWNFVRLSRQVALPLVVVITLKACMWILGCSSLSFAKVFALRDDFMKIIMLVVE